MYQCISHIELIGTTCNADGAYERDWPCWDSFQQPEERTARWGGQRVTFEIKFLKENDYEGWAIVRRNPQEYDEDGVRIFDDDIVEKRCWIAPCTTNRKHPPLKGWVPCDPLASGNPTIKYILNNSIE